MKAENQGTEGGRRKVAAGKWPPSIAAGSFGTAVRRGRILHNFACGDVKTARGIRSAEYSVLRTECNTMNSMLAPELAAHPVSEDRRRQKLAAPLTPGSNYGSPPAILPFIFYIAALSALEPQLSVFRSRFLFLQSEYIHILSTEHLLHDSRGSMLCRSASTFPTIPLLLRNSTPHRRRTTSSWSFLATTE